MNLNYKVLGNTGTNVLILHGLLGSLDNWHSIAKILAQTHTVYCIDQRNHGRSPHSTEMSYEILAQDIVEFCQIHNLTKVSIIGHSMGGKVAMLIALLHPQLIDKLIVIDIAPAWYDGGHESILFAMAEAPLAIMQKREEVELFLQPRIHDAGVRQFIMKNLTRNDNGQFEWKCNFEALITHYRKLMDFPTLDIKYNGKTYFIKGEHSNYLNQDNWGTCDLYFPNNVMYEIPNAGHWVHADNQPILLDKLKTILS